MVEEFAHLVGFIYPCTKFHMSLSNGALALRKNDCNRRCVFEIRCTDPILLKI